MQRPRSLCEMRPASENNQSQNKYTSSLPEGYLEKIPQYQNLKKEFPSKTKKPMLFHERGYLIRNFDRKQIEDITTKEQTINFLKLLSQFKSEDEVKSVQVSDIFGVDSQLLTHLQEKCRNFADVTSYIAEVEEKEGKHDEAKNDQDFMAYLMEMIIPMIQTSINLDIVISNLKSIDCINYSADLVKVYFKNKN